MTDGGKSTLARALFLTASAPRLVIDPQASSITAVPGAVTFTDPRRLPDAATARFVPRDPDDTDAYHELYSAVREKVLRAVGAGRPQDAHFYIWCDEAGIVLPVGKPPKAGRRVVVADRKLMIGHLACHARPRDVLRHVAAQAAHVGVWDLPLEEDRRYIAGMCGIPYRLFEAALGRMGPHDCVWWNRRARTLYPLTLELTG
ncbi:MAG TPA: hypothetical protein VMR97_07870 [Acidimicrobiales bacterium]|nr:hypothetical protein [Acidimicrobiales bacterium]